MVNLGLSNSDRVPYPDDRRFLTVRLVDTASGNPASAYEAGDTVDGLVLVAGDRILRATSGGNASDGIYVVPTSGAASRHPYFTAYDQHHGVIVSVMEGSSAENVWRCASPLGGTIGSTALEFKKLVAEPSISGLGASILFT